MRMMLRISVAVEPANRAIQDGSLIRILDSTMRKIRPEASYFLAESGRRTALFFFDMKDPSEIPQIAEPLFIGLSAEVEFVPVMNRDELQKGLSSWADTRD